MEILILILSDPATRKILLSVPQRYFEALPTDKLVEYGVNAGVQFAGDAAIVVGTTAAGTFATPGAGNAAGLAIGLTVTSLRKAGKALEMISDNLMSVIKIVKRKRNKNKFNNSGSKSDDQTSLPKGKENNKNDDKKRVSPTIDIDPPEPYDDDETEKHRLPVRCGITGPDKASYNGKGTITTNGGKTSLFEDKKLTQKAKARYSSAELKKDKVLCLTVEVAGKISLKHSLSPQSGFTVANPDTATIDLLEASYIQKLKFHSIKPKKVLPGNNGEVAVIGRSMGQIEKRDEYGVVDYARKLKKWGYKTELFAGSRLPDSAREQIKRWQKKHGEILPDEILFKTDAYKLNMAWAKKLKSKGYIVVDIGNPNNKPSLGPFYSGEHDIIFGALDE